MKVPPAFSVPAPENMILEEVPPVVMFPETVTVPEEIVMTVSRLALAAPLRAIEAAVNVPAPTAMVDEALLVGTTLHMVMAPDTLRMLVPSVRVIPLLAPLPAGALTVMEVQAAVYALGTVTVMPELTVTVSPLIGTLDPPQVAVLFQLPVTEAVLAAANADKGLSSMTSKASSCTAKSFFTRYLNMAELLCLHLPPRYTMQNTTDRSSKKRAIRQDIQDYDFGSRELATETAFTN